MINATINGVPVACEEGTTILEAARSLASLFEGMARLLRSEADAGEG